MVHCSFVQYYEGRQGKFLDLVHFHHLHPRSRFEFKCVLWNNFQRRHWRLTYCWVIGHAGHDRKFVACSEIIAISMTRLCFPFTLETLNMAFPTILTQNCGSWMSPCSCPESILVYLAVYRHCSLDFTRSLKYVVTDHSWAKLKGQACLHHHCIIVCFQRD